MAPQRKNYVCDTCCDLDIAKATLHPKRSDIDYFGSLEFKPRPHGDYDEATAAGCRYCSLISKCLADIPNEDTNTRKIGLRLTLDCPPIVTNRNGISLRIIFKNLSTDTSWDTIPFRSSVSVLDIAHATKWIEARLKECFSHQQCDLFTTVGPKRLLRLGPENHVCIINTPKQMPKFVALSYCWGGDQESKLTQKTIDLFRDELPWNRLTVLHRDVITLCRNLGIEYLWIDALCIIQDNRDDWVDQAAVMADIYENAHLTISATCCPNPRQSLFGRGGTGYGGEEKELHRSEDGALLLVSRKHIQVGHHNVLYGSAEEDLLETRGWCFQESRLSRRMISFTSKELQWQCRQRRTCECGDLATEDMHSMLLFKGMEPIKKSEAYRLWDRLLQQYSRTRLTKAEDRLVALAGLASRVALFTESAYIAGLWRDNLTVSLLWNSKSASRSFSTEYRAPTFSWASVDSPVEMVRHLEYATAGVWKTTIEVIDAHVDLKSKDSPFGEVTDGFLRVKGMVSAAELMTMGSGKNTVVLDGLGQTRVSVLVDGKLTHATNLEGVATIARLRTARPNKASSAKASTASAGTSDDAYSSSGDNKKGDEDEDEDDDLNDSSSGSDQKNRLLPLNVQLLHLGFLTRDTYTSYCLILGRSPAQRDRYERLGLMKWKHKGGWRDSVVERLKKLPKHEVIIV